MRGQQIQDGTIEQSKLNLTAPTTGTQAVTKNYGISKYIGYNTLTSFRQTNKSELSDKIIIGDYLYKYDATDTTSVDNGFSIIKTNDSKVYKKIYNIITPEDFGAKGDGITNDTAAIQNALDFPNNTLYFTPNKEYLTISELTIPSNKRIIGNGAIIRHPNNNFTNGLSIIGKDNVIIDNLHVIGKTGENSFDSAYVILDSRNVTIENCRIENIGYENLTTERGFGILISTTLSSPWIEPTNTLGSKNIKILNNTIKNIKGYGSYRGDFILTISATDIFINNNTMDTCRRQGIALCDFSSNIKITNNTILNTYLDGIDIEPNEMEGAVHGVIIDSNYIEGFGIKPGATIGVQFYGIDLHSNNSYDINITKNEITSTNTQAISGIHAQNGVFNISIDNNIINGNLLLSNGISLSAGNGINNSTISNNRIKGFKEAGIVGYSCLGLNIKDNFINTTIGKNGIALNQSKANITGNHIILNSANTLNGIYLINDSEHKISNNKVEVNLGNAYHLEAASGTTITYLINGNFAYNLGTATWAFNTDISTGGKFRGKFDSNNFALNSFTNILSAATLINEITPEMFGAGGDGVIDDTIPIQKMLDVGGNMIMNNKYKITSKLSTTLSINKDLNISGEGEIIFNGYYIALEVKSDTGLGNFNIDGIKITGTMVDSLDNVLYAQGISVNGILNTSIKNSHFKNIYGDGIRIYNCKGTSEVINNTFVNVGGLNPTIDTPSGLLDHYGDGVLAVLSTNVTIENNTIINDTAARGFYGRGGIIFDNHGGGKIVNNIIRGYSRGIHIEATEQHCYILNNDVRKCPCGIITAFSGGHVIEGNYFSNEGSENYPAVIGQYLINNYSTTSGSLFKNNIIKVDTTAGKVPTTGIQCQGDGSVYEDNIIDATIFLYGTTRHIFRKNKIKSSFIQHNFSDVIFEDNDLNVSHFEYAAGTSAKFIRNKIYNTETGGLGTIIGYNSPNFALIDNEIVDPRSFIISNGGSDSYGEISGNKLMLTGSSYATPWGQYNPYFSTVPLFTKKDNYSYLAGNIVDRGYYFTGKFYENGTGVVYVVSVPTTGKWEVRDVAYNIAPTVGQPKGWICTVAGTPGTWVSLGNL